MKTIRISHRVTKEALAETARVLDAGGVVAFPTETSYGLAADPTDVKAVAGVYAIKGRPRRKPLPLIAASLGAVEGCFVMSPRMRRLAARHWPGPLTLVLPFKRGLRLPASAGEKSGAVRVPSSPWARAVAAACGGVVTSTSANLSGDAAIYDSKALRRAFARRKARPDLLLDIGVLPKRAASSIVAEKGGTLLELRAGSVSSKIFSRGRSAARSGNAKARMNRKT